MIEVENLVKRYGPHTAVDQISFKVEPGQVVGFLGPNGAGKSTTIRILTGYIPATSGSAKVCDHDCLTESIKVRQSIGYLPESNAIYHEMRVEEMLHFLGKLHGVPRKTRKHQIDELTEACGLEKIRKRIIGHLSKGNRQRVGIAQALLHDPPVLILDEPGAGLDPVQITQVRKLIQKLGKKKTILFSTHILPEAEMTCERLIVITNGKIVADGSPHALVQKMREESRIIVEVLCDETELFQALKKIKGVASVRTTSDEDQDWAVAAVEPEEDAGDLREAIGGVIMENNWIIREMRFEAATLEEFFIKATSRHSFDHDEPSVDKTIIKRI